MTLAAVQQRKAERAKRFRETRAQLARWERARKSQDAKRRKAERLITELDSKIAKARANLKRVMPPPVRPVNVLPWEPPRRPPRLTDSTR